MHPRSGQIWTCWRSHPILTLTNPRFLFPWRGLFDVNTRPSWVLLSIFRLYPVRSRAKQRNFVSRTAVFGRGTTAAKNEKSAHSLPSRAYVLPAAGPDIVQSPGWVNWAITVVFPSGRLGGPLPVDRPPTSRLRELARKAIRRPPGLRPPVAQSNGYAFHSVDLAPELQRHRTWACGRAGSFGLAELARVRVLIFSTQPNSCSLVCTAKSATGLCLRDYVRLIDLDQDSHKRRELGVIGWASNRSCTTVKRFNILISANPHAKFSSKLIQLTQPIFPLPLAPLTAIGCIDSTPDPAFIPFGSRWNELCLGVFGDILFTGGSRR